MIEPAARAAPSEPSLLQQLTAGVTLRKVDTEVLAAERERQGHHAVDSDGGILGAIARTMDKRRAAVNHSSDEEDDGSSSDSGWSSEG